MSDQRFLHAHLTPARLTYLRAVEAAGVYDKRHGVVANHCIRLGWVDGVLRMPDGSLLPYEQREPGSSWEGVTWAGQTLTEEGREMLRRASDV